MGLGRPLKAVEPWDGWVGLGWKGPRRSEDGLGGSLKVTGCVGKVFEGHGWGWEGP